MTNFEQHKRDHDKWFSPPFYTHPKGYKMCLYVYAAGGAGVNAHVSPFLMLMRGQCDDQLEWPLRGTFSVQLLSQNGDEGHDNDNNIVVEIPFDDNTRDLYCSRVVDADLHGYGWGCPTFIAHTKLKPRYLQDDCLKFYIKKVN